MLAALYATEEAIRGLSLPRIEEQLSRPEWGPLLASAFCTKYDFFISYRHRDRADYAIDVASKLRMAGHRVFIDKDYFREPISDEALTTQLRAAVRQSACILHVVGHDAFGGDWIDFESTTSTRGRYALAIDLILGNLDERTATFVRMRRQYASVCLFEEDGPLASRTTVINAALALAMYRRWMLARSWTWLLPISRRYASYRRCVINSRSCRRWLMELLRHQGYFI